MAKIKEAFGLNTRAWPERNLELQKQVANIIAYHGWDRALAKCLEVWPVVVDSETGFGLEIEAEACGGAHIELPHWTVKEDGSLRNGGREFVSAPLTGRAIREAIFLLFQTLKRTNELQPDFSWRTSVHVHMNIREMSHEAFHRLLVLYCIFEKSLFTFAGHGRDNSIFCVPIGSSTIPKMIGEKVGLYGLNHREVVSSIAGRWEKYSAINLTRLKDLGTIEFRHLPGFENTDKLLTWINFMSRLYNSACELKDKELKESVFSLNSTSQYRDFASDVFGVQIRFLDNADFDRQISQGITVAKLCYPLSNNFSGQPKPESAFMKARGKEKKKESQENEYNELMPQQQPINQMGIRAAQAADAGGLFQQAIQFLNQPPPEPGWPMENYQANNDEDNDEEGPF